jgi:hypothetical protein
MQGEGATQHTTPFVDTVTPEVDWIFLPTKALCCILVPIMLKSIFHINLTSSEGRLHKKNQRGQDKID